MSASRAAAALLLLVAAFGVLAALLMPNPPAHAMTAAQPSAARTATLGGAQPHGTGVAPDLAVLDAAAPTEPLSPAQATEALYAADRVCDGLTSEVPEGFMIREVADSQGMTLADAHAFVEAAITRCPLR